MLVKFQQEKMSVLFDEGAELLQAHYEEVARYQDIALKPDCDKYFKIEEIGNLCVYTARGTEGELIGYSVYFLSKNMHYSDSLQATQDILYIKKDRRGFGAEFVRWCDDQLALRGVQVVYHHVKAKKELNFGPMLERQGYELIDLIYGRRLD
jgi:hypothetical protein